MAVGSIRTSLGHEHDNRLRRDRPQLHDADVGLGGKTSPLCARVLGWLSPVERFRLLVRSLAVRRRRTHLGSRRIATVRRAAVERNLNANRSRRRSNSPDYPESVWPLGAANRRCGTPAPHKPGGQRPPRPGRRRRGQPDALPASHFFVCLDLTLLAPHNRMVTPREGRCKWPKGTCPRSRYLTPPLRSR